jgi:pyruvate dehydrogenase E2 component (dihydrolipoamide acetyltransferase)
MHMLMMPRLGQTMTKGKLVEWLIEVGQSYQEGTLIYTIETDKTVLEVEANLPGVLLRRLIESDEEVPVGAQVGVSADVGEAVTEDRIAQFLKANASSDGFGHEAENEAAFSPSQQSEENAPRAMPNVRSRAKELGVDLAELSRARGKTGVISKQDVEDFAATRAGSVLQKPQASPRARSLQSAMAKRMSESWLVPQFTQDVELEIGALKARKERLAAEGHKISFASLILDALTRALKDVPACNGIYANDEFAPGETVDAGIAIATAEGLVVPVLRNCEAVDLLTRARNFDTLVQRARAGQLTPDEASGASVTLSVLNNTRVQTGTPILNAPQVCLLFCGAPVVKPVVKNGSIVPGETIHLVSVYDHRVIDGTTGAKFMDALCTYLSA